jgi:hypothetical protein
VPVRLYFGEDVLDFAVGTDHESGAGDAHDFFPVHIFFLDYAEGFRNFLICVGEEGKREIEFILKFLLCFRRVGGDAKQHGAGFLNLFIGIAEGAGLDGASRSIGAGVEKEDYDFAAQTL